MAVWLLRSFTSIKDHVLHVSLRKRKSLKIVVVFLFRCWAKISQALAGDQNFPSGHWKKFQNSTYSTLCITINSSSHFERINNFNCDFLFWQILALVCPLKNHVTLLLPISILKHMQRWQVSWIRSIKSNRKSNKVRSVCTFICQWISSFSNDYWFYNCHVNVCSVTATLS